MNINPTHILAVGAGGFFGAMSRFYIGTYIAKLFPHEVPLATLSVNILGSFIIGILTAIFLHFTPNESFRLFIITGFLGALTTYSTFALESYMLLNTSFAYAILNIALNVVGTITAVMLGYKLVSKFVII